MKKIFIIMAVFSVYLLSANNKLTVSILPQKYFLQKIVKNKFDINVMVQPGFSPGNYEPKISQMKSLIKSKAYFYIGVPFENTWLEKFRKIAPKTIFVNSIYNIKKQSIGIVNKSNNKKVILDPHVWLDPVLVKEITKNMYKAIIKIDPLNTSFYRKNYEVFMDEINELDVNIQNIFSKKIDKTFMLYHPSWKYFAKRYGLKCISIEIEGKKPKPKQIIKIIKEAKKNKIKTIFTSVQFSQDSVKTIAKNVDANIIAIDPLAYEWERNLLYVSNVLNKSFLK